MKISTFQIIFTGIFVLFIGAGVVAFSLYTAKDNSVGTVVIWGEADQTAMQGIIIALNQQDSAFQDVVYVQKPATTYTTELINAMASGAGPDLVLLSNEHIVQFTDKLYVIPYSTVSQSAYVSSYMYEGQLFLTPEGVIAMPLLIDPMVMYWNRSILASAGIAKPPVYWNDLLSQAQKLTVLDDSKNIKRSAVAMGGWSNVRHAKEILSMLFMQAGDPIVEGYPGALSLTFGRAIQGVSENPAASALQFYTEFANPSKVTYSWNRSMPNSQDAFTSGDLALYFGFASEYSAIASRNPNLSFGIAKIPQIEGNSSHSTFGRLVGVSIPRTAANPQGALTIAQKLSAQNTAAFIGQTFGLPSVRLDDASDTAASVASEIMYQSALISRAWFDPDPVQTGDILSSMVSDVISNKTLPYQAVSEASQSLRALISSFTQ